MIKRFWLRFCVVVAVLWSTGELISPGFAQTNSQPIYVSDIQVRGNRRVTRETILANIRTQPGAPYVLATLEEDVRRLANMRVFRDVKVITPDDGPNRKTIIFEVEEFPNVVTDVVILGGRHLNKTELLQLKLIRKGSRLNPTVNRRAAIEMEQFYHAKGRIYAKVELLEGGRTGDTRVVFRITEGPIVRIRSINFTGNQTLAGSDRLRTQINSKKVFMYLIGGVYNRLMVENDVRKLEEYYRNNGYLGVRVSREVKFSYDGAWVDLIFHINEGTRFKVGRVSVQGVHNLHKAQVEKVVRTRSQQYYNGITSETDLRDIRDVYGWRGYAVGVREERYPSEKDGLVHVVYQVADKVRDPARVGRVIIQGNKITKDRVIRNRLPFRPGQILRLPELRIAKNNLIRSNLFEMNPELGIAPSVTILEDPMNPDSPVKDILVNVRETYTGSLMFGVGVNSDAGLVGSVVLNERNFDIFRPPLSLNDIFEGRAFRGGGQEFRAEAVPGTELQRYSVMFREPFLFDRPYSLTLSAYYRDRIFREYTERRVGGRVTIGHQINQFWSVSGGVRIEGVRVDDVPFFAPIDYTSAQGNNFVLAPRVSLVRDSRDSFLRPTKGSYMEASYEHVFGDFTYPVVNLEASRYFTTYQRRDGSGKHVLAARAQVSWAGDDVPVYDRFFAGGFRSMRGFEFRGVGPFVDDFNVGGNFMILTSLEYQVPIRANDKIYLVAFVDAGTVERDVEITNFRVAAGFGARIVVPMMGQVPIALDFGFPIVRGPHDREQIFAFYVGLFR